MIRLAAAILALSIASPQDEVTWTRTFKEKAKNSYDLIMKLDKPSMTVSCGVSTTVLSVKAGAKPVVLLEATDVEMSGFANATDPAPAPLKSAVSSNGIPDRLVLDATKRTNPVYFIVGAAGATADKKVKAGDTFRISWKNAGKEMTLDGKGKVLEIDPAGKTIKAEIKYAVTVSGSGGGELEYDLTSVSSTVDGALLSAKGTFGFGPLIWQIEIGKAAGGRT